MPTPFSCGMPGDVILSEAKDLCDVELVPVGNDAESRRRRDRKISADYADVRR